MSNLVAGQFEVRPGKMGLGAAAFFPRNKFLRMSHTKEYDAKELTVVIWVYLRRHEKKEVLCPVFLKGNDSPLNKTYARAPGIFINQMTGTIYAFTSTVDNKEGDSTRTLGYIKPRKWTQVTVVFSLKSTKIYLNGILDGFSTRSTATLNNIDDVFIGGHPNYLKQCSLEMTIDSLRMYSRELFIYEIQAGIKSSLGIIEPSYIHLGCFDCTFAEAQSKCVKNYKLCTSEDLYSGVWQAAHIMGWVNFVLTAD